MITAWHRSCSQWTHLQESIVSALSLEAFQSQLGMLLRDLPPGMVAELSDFALAYWNGHEVVYCFLNDDKHRQIDEEFDINDYVWEEWAPVFAAWCAAPTFSKRPEVLNWLKDAPPYDVGV
jgi:hypothetical protein